MFSLDHRKDASIRENKAADLKARLRISREHPDTPFLSVHLNYFTQRKYKGAQVFYGRGSKSDVLAETIQKKLALVSFEENHRKAKPAGEGIFLMNEIASPSVTIECGFLSNPEECLLLQDEEYQKAIAVAIISGFTDFFGGGKNE